MEQLFDFRQILRHLFEGIGVAIAAYLISGQRYTFRETVTIGLTAAVTILVLDNFAPDVASGARQGTGFGLGFQTVNLPAAAMQPGFGIPVLPIEGFDGQSTYVLPSRMSQIGGDCGRAHYEISGEAQQGGVQGDVQQDSTGVEMASDVGYNKDCACVLGCASRCQLGDECKLNCPPNVGVPPAPPACHRDSCDISVSGCPYKLIPGYYSHRVLLPGYNECVQPYNS